MPKAKKSESAPAKPEKKSRGKKKVDSDDEVVHEKKRKAKKDPNAPKKPCGAYMWFCKDTRESVKAEHPDWSVTQIGKRLGELWKLTADDDKQKFFAQAEEDKVRYQRDLAHYKSGVAAAAEEEDDE